MRRRRAAPPQPVAEPPHAASPTTAPSQAAHLRRHGLPPAQSSTSPSPRAKRRQKRAALLPCAFGGRAPPPPPAAAAAAARGARDLGCLAAGRSALRNRPRERSGRDRQVDEEEVEPEAHGPANTSTSNTLVLFEDRRIVPVPPQDDPEASTPVPSPRAPKPKKAKTGAAGKQEIATGSMSAPLLEDPLIKELVNLGSQFIGFRKEAATLREALHCVEGRADDLEAKLKANEEACKRAEKDATGVEDLRRMLQAAEDALSDKEAKQVERDNDIIMHLETQSRRFSTGRWCLTSARNALKHVFPHFFPKDTQAKIFSQLVQHFLEKDDPTLVYRQASLKIGVEGTIALVATSGQKVDWVKTGAPKGLNSEKWKALVKDAKLYSKKLIAFLDPKSSSSASAAQT
ncbi:hypothetical protein QYE76_034564 [Lolium multiflorum]|uniref:Uncharacterized protein n=1 Tax=Lolium multiflorum TaxID=4521 RepID=A0AAD8QXZ2_LOLMU|nr:hypothetical protein QYE76_034564 [Lolium multiflorum]